MKMTIYEGTADDIAKVARVLQQGGTNPTPDGTFEDSATPDTDGSTDSLASETLEEVAAVEFARRVLTRRPLHRRPKIVFEKLVDAFPQWVSRDELCAATGYTPQQLAGLMGAFGRRTVQTKGYVDGASLFETESDPETQAYRYRLTESTFEALRSGDVI